MNQQNKKVLRTRNSHPLYSTYTSSSSMSM